MSLCTFAFPGQFNLAVASDLRKQSHLCAHLLFGANLYSQLPHKLNQIRKKSGGICANLSETGEYHSKRPPTPLLDTIDYPIHMKNLSVKELKQLADELRSDVIFNVSKTGGHLGSSLGVVELTVALHYVFNAPQDKILWDVGHQSYPHKILTGRRDKMHTMRQTNGLAGFTKRSESDYDCFGTGHSSTTISAGLGMAVGRDLKGSRLLAAYVNCQKIGAPPEVVARLEEAYTSVAEMGGRSGTSTIGEDPGLDQFMEAYCEMLTKYEQELSKPFKEAMLFLSRIECQFKALTITSSDSACAEAMDRNGSSDEEEVDVNNNLIDPQAEDRELKGQLLRKYSGYLGSLKQEFMKKRKKGKLPKEARQQLLEWWSRHYKWPYPSESQKLALAESTGLDQKQINNWFINQRKRHWKPSEDMQFAAHPTHYYMDNVLGNPFPMDISPPLL